MKCAESMLTLRANVEAMALTEQPLLHELRNLRHDLRDHVQALSMGIQILDAAIAERDWNQAHKTLSQIFDAVQSLQQQKFISGDWPAQWPHE